MSTDEKEKGKAKKNREFDASYAANTFEHKRIEQKDKAEKRRF